jgi:hypothetical protein
MYIPQITFAKLLHAKMFLGGARRMWNPEIVGYLSGIRNRSSILDVTQTSFRLKKFLGFVELTSVRRGRVMIILRPAFAPLAELIYPLADYFPRYIGGALSNLPFTGYHAMTKARKKIMVKGKFFVRYPSIAVLFGDHTRRVDFMVNETLCTRTPSALLCDATTFSAAIPYHIPTPSDFAAARLMTHHVLTAIRRGRRHEKLSLRRTFRSLITSAVKKHLHIASNVYPNKVVKTLNIAAFFAADPLRRLSLLKFYFSHKLEFFRPTTFRVNIYVDKINTQVQSTRFLNIHTMLKPIFIIRKGFVLARLFKHMITHYKCIPILGKKALEELIFAGPRLRIRKMLKKEAKRESKLIRIKKHYAHKNITRRTNIAKNPFQKHLPDSIKKKRNRLKLLAGHKPEYAIRILGEAIKGIRSQHKLKKIWKMLVKYPDLRERLFLGRTHNIIKTKVNLNSSVEK